MMPEMLGVAPIADVDGAGTPSPFYQACLSDLDDQVYLLELQPWRIGSTSGTGVRARPIMVDPIFSIPVSGGTGGLVSLQYSDAGYISENYGTLPSQLFEGRVTQPLRMTWTVPVAPEVDRRVTLEIANVEIINSDGQLDDLIRTYDVGGRDVTVKIGLKSFPYEYFTPVWSGVADSWARTMTAFTIAARDQGYRLAVPLQSVLYGGTGGADGTADMANKPKPLCFGKCLNITPVSIDPANLVYQFHSRAVEAVDAVYDRAAALSFSADYATYSALIAASLSVGQYATCLAAGMIRVGGTPSGVLTADVRGDAAGSYIDTTAAIVERLLTDFAGISSDSIDADGFSAFAVAVPGTIGWYQTDSITVEDAVTAVVAHCGAWWGALPTGEFTIGILDEPDQSNVAYDLKFADLIDLDILDPPQGTMPPRFRQRVAYQKNWTVQTGQEVAPSVTAARRLTLSQPYSVAAAQNSATESDFLLAQDPNVMPALFDQESDALSIAQRFVGLLSVQRFTVRCSLDIRGHLLPRGATVTVTHPRLNGGQTTAMRVIGQEIDCGNRKINVILWG